MSESPINRDLIPHLARLARLRIDEQEAERLHDEMARILAFVSALDAIDLDDLEPLPRPANVVNRLHDDEAGTPLALGDLTRNAPAIEDRFVAVPKVIGSGDSS
ncbi:MAG: Asp-tRNA(Asn)/Glu-tRNA(Gln) amidotransferase subunit GatC [Planctomycetota bacterium]